MNNRAREWKTNPRKRIRRTRFFQVRGILLVDMAYSQEFRDQLIASQDAFVWEAPSWEWQSRGPSWYLWLGLVALVLVAYSIFTSNYLFAFIILLFSIIVILAGNEPPHPVLVQIGDHGIVFDGELYLYQDLNDFAIIFQPPETKVLYIQPKNLVRARLRIPLEDQNPVPIRLHLKQFVNEDLELRDEHASDIVARLLKL